MRLPSLWETYKLLCHAMHFLQLHRWYSFISYVKITPSKDTCTVESHGLHSLVKQEKSGRKILVRPRNSLALTLTSLPWESQKGLLLVSLKTIEINVFNWHNPTISKGCWFLPKLLCHEIISYVIIFVVCSVVYMPLVPGFCFIKISKTISFTQWYIKSRSTSQTHLVFITSRRSHRCRVSIGDLLILAQNHQKRARRRKRGKLRTFGKVVLL